MQQPETLTTLVRLAEALERNPHIAVKLEQALAEERVLHGVKDVMTWTGWGASHIRQLCQMNKLPHIPGKELKFIYADVINALQKMQRGGEYRKRPSTPKPRKEKS